MSAERETAGAPEERAAEGVSPYKGEKKTAGDEPAEEDPYALKLPKVEQDEAAELETATDSYVLIGAAKGESGALHIVEVVVNRFDNEVVSIDVLYSVNAKKESAVLNAPESTEDPLLVTDSALSIARLLDLARANYSDILPESVLRHYGFDARPAGKLGNSALFSRENVRTSPLAGKVVLEYDRDMLRRNSSTMRCGRSPGRWRGPAPSRTEPSAGVSFSKFNCNVH